MTKTMMQTAKRTEKELLTKEVDDEKAYVLEAMSKTKSFENKMKIIEVKLKSAMNDIAGDNELISNKTMRKLFRR